MRKCQQVNSRRRAQSHTRREHSHRKLMRILNHKEQHPPRYTEIEGQTVVGIAAASASVIRQIKKAATNKWRVRR